MKKRLEVEPVRTTKEILKDFDFLPYSTRKRNMAHQVLYLDFQVKLLKAYKIYGGLNNLVARNIILTSVNIIEHLLFWIYYQENKKVRSDSLPTLIGFACKKRVIDGEFAKKLNKVIDLRNKIHPRKQSEDLDVKTFGNNEMTFCLANMNELISKMRDFYKAKDEEIGVDDERCSYEEYHHIFCQDYGQCPYCFQTI